MSAETIAFRIVRQFAQSLAPNEQRMLCKEIEIALLRQLEQVRLEFYKQGYEDAKKQIAKNG